MEKSIEQMKEAVIQREVDYLMEQACRADVDDFVRWAFRGTTDEEWQSEYNEAFELGFIDEEGGQG